jgi:DNA-binding NarL/FixJ family response regulator
LPENADGQNRSRRSAVVISDLDYLEAARRFETRKTNRDDKVITWTRKREELLKDLVALGLDPAIIAIELGFGERTVRVRMNMLGLNRNRGDIF